MRWWVGLVSLGLGLEAVGQTALEAEAKRLTSELRVHDKYAVVLTFEQWRRSQEERQLSSEVTVSADGLLTGYIKLANFYPTRLCRDFRNELLKFKQAKVSRLIVDLRGNPGGQRLSAICIAGLLIGPHPIVGLKDVPVVIPNMDKWVEDSLFTVRAEMRWRMGITEQETDSPMVLLIDRSSASASELVAGALRDHQRAWIVGQRSLGKGMAQEYVPVKGRPELIIGYTIQQFYSPAGISPEGIGISPTPLPPAVRECVFQKARAGGTDPERDYAEAVLDCGGQRP